MKAGSIHVLQGGESHRFFSPSACHFQCIFHSKAKTILTIRHESVAMVAPTARLNSGFSRFGRMAADTGQIVWVLVEGGWGGVG